MKQVTWTDRARLHLKAHIDWYNRLSGDAAKAMARDTLKMVALLGRQIDTGRPSSIEGLREKSLPKWHKIIVYDLTDDAVTIIAIIDTRMDDPLREIFK